MGTLTSHGAKSKELLCIIVVGGTTPPHAITTPIRGALCVVATAVEEGKVTEGAVGVSTSCRHNGWDGDTHKMITSKL